MEPVFSVSELNQAVANTLSENFYRVNVEGEISNLKVASSAHVYFTLKDEFAQIRCALFKNQKLRLGIPILDGMRVLVQAEVSLYTVKGEYQLIVHNLAEIGDGRLKRLFEELKQRLAQRGWFEPALKKPLPRLPQRIGVISSATGAAIHDILVTLRRRFPLIPILIYPTAVQGADAEWQIAAAIRQAQQNQLCDVLILARGGGSLEDLWAFNTETVATAIRESHIPIVTGIGHEVDVTIADLVADRRAATPTAAAELVAPNYQEYLQKLQIDQQKLRSLLGLLLRAKHQQLQIIQSRLVQQQPQHKLAQQHQQLQAYLARLRWLINNQLLKNKNNLSNYAKLLHNLSPLQILGRGFSLTQNLDGSIIKNISQVPIGSTIITQLTDGKIVSQVKDTQHD